MVMQMKTPRLRHYALNGAVDGRRRIQAGSHHVKGGYVTGEYGHNSLSGHPGLISHPKLTGDQSERSKF